MTYVDTYITDFLLVTFSNHSHTPLPPPPFICYAFMSMKTVKQNQQSTWFMVLQR